MVETSLIVLSCGLFVVILILAFVLFQQMEKNKDLISDLSRLEVCDCENTPTICDTTDLDEQILSLQEQLSARPLECGPNTTQDENGICIATVATENSTPLNIVAISLLSVVLFVAILLLIRREVVKYNKVKSDVPHFRDVSVSAVPSTRISTADIRLRRTF